MKNGSMIFLCKDQFRVDLPTVGGIEINSNTNTGDFVISLNNIAVPSGIEKVQIPVWCDANQNDLVWYTAEKQGEQYIVESNISRHKYHTGVYNVGIYVLDGNGFFTGITSRTMDFTLMNGTFLPIVSISDGVIYRATLTQTSLSGIGKRVLFAVWSENGGQDDLAWYTATWINKNYALNIPMANHMTTGLYNVCAYVELQDGSMRGLTSTTFTVNSLPGEKIEVSNSNGVDGTFDVSVYVVRNESQVSSVLVPVWSEADQSDLVWYSANKTEDGIYSLKVDVKNHNENFGKYQVNAYVQGKDGSLSGLGSTSTVLNANNYITTTVLSDSFYQIRIQGANIDGNTANAVRFPTWSDAGNQDDLLWYEGQTQGNGEFIVTIYRGNHKRDGAYTTHVYLYVGGTVRGLGQQYHYNLANPTTYDTYAQSVMVKIIYAVETGGQVYGNARYSDFTQAYTNSTKETAITIGAGAWFATEAKRLLSLIREEDSANFIRLDTAGIGKDIDEANWSSYGGDGNGKAIILKGSEKAIAIQNIISSDAGIRVQDRLVNQQMQTYINEAGALGVSDLKARMFCANVRHLGGYSAMKWVIECCIEDGKILTMDNLWNSMRSHTTNLDGNGVGANKYKSRHEKVMSWLNTYIG